MWLLPSAAATHLIKEAKAESLKPTAYDSLVRRHGLSRLPQSVMDKFLSLSRKDAVTLQLRAEVEKAVGFSLERTRRGRPRGGIRPARISKRLEY
jgi:hypothetical protein